MVATAASIADMYDQEAEAVCNQNERGFGRAYGFILTLDPWLTIRPVPLARLYPLKPGITRFPAGLPMAGSAVAQTWPIQHQRLTAHESASISIM